MKWNLLVVFLLAQPAFAQPPDGGGPLPQPHHAGGAFIDEALQRAHANATGSGSARGAAPLLRWPLRETITVEADSIQSIVNFVDHDNSGGALDYNCGHRTYNGHRGLDIALTPFPWYQMEQDAGIVVAAAEGTIAEKVDGNPERSCSRDNANSESNVIIIEHADGSLAIYSHLRTGSLTAKPVGAVVSTGEYLGVVGSSGNSTQPHLHFEVGFMVAQGRSLVWQHHDPWAGSCNNLDNESWWQSQPSYYEPTLLQVASHAAPPEWPNCPQTERPHFADSFAAGDTVYLSASYRDQLRGQQSTLTVRRPDGSVFYRWDHATDEPHYPASYWYWYIDLPSTAMRGEWTFTVEFEGQTKTHAFSVDTLPPQAPSLSPDNNAYNGLYFDPALEGEGYNVITAATGTVIVYYGSDAQGRRLWLISGIVTDEMRDGEELTVPMYESSGGTFARPIISQRGLSPWGMLSVTFDNCERGVAVLTGADGRKTSRLVKLVAVPGTQCGGARTDEAPVSGLWFDQKLEGEGFNLIVANSGAVVMYYGFDTSGDRLWLIGGPFDGRLEVGSRVTGDLLKATSGTFGEPAPSNQLVKWGTIAIEPLSCNEMNFTLDIRDGHKFSETVRLAGVIGLECE